jgi:hypothetical protein
MVAEAMRLPADGTLTGQPITLLQAVASTADRRRQYEVVRAYWRLVQTVADHRFCADYVQQLARLSGREDTPAILTAVAASSAIAREADAAVVEAQCDLAALLGFPPSPCPPTGLMWARTVRVSRSCSEDACRRNECN